MVLHRFRKQRAAILVLFLAIVIAACGGDAEVLTGDIASQQPGLATTAPTPSAAEPRPVATVSPTPTVEPTPPPTPKPTTIPVDIVELEVADNVGLHRGTTIEVLGAQATNARPSLVLQGDAIQADPDGRHWVTLTLGITNETSRTFYHAPPDYLLTNPQGRSTGSVGLLDSRGAEGTWSISQREFVEVRVAFLTSEPVTDLAGWTLTYDKEGSVPEVIALAEMADRIYPLELTLPGDVATLNEAAHETFGGSCGFDGVFDFEITSVTVQLDPFYLDSLSQAESRAARGARWVIITAQATNRNTIGYPCGLISDSIKYYDVRLLANGRSTVAEGDGTFGVQAGKVVEGASEEVVYTFLVPVETTTLELIGGAEETLIQAWDVELPTIDGD